MYNNTFIWISQQLAASMSTSSIASGNDDLVEQLITENKALKAEVQALKPKMSATHRQRPHSLLSTQNQVKPP